MQLQKGVHCNREWFQQDGATPHAAIATLEMLHNVFGDRIISRRTVNNWSAHSPDLNPLDYFLWGHLKNQVYANQPETLDDLEEEIRRCAATVTADTCRRTIANFIKRVRECVRQKGHHFEQLM